MKFQRSKSVHFTATEKYILLNIIYNYKDILESQKADAETWKIKQETWKKIENCFNVLSDHNIYRTAKSLRKFYENKKKEIQIAKERSEMLKVDGVPLMTKDDSCKELLLDSANNDFVTDEADSSEDIVIEEIVCNTNQAVSSKNSSEETINLQLLDANWENHKAVDPQKLINGESSEKINMSKTGKRKFKKRPMAITSLTTSDLSKTYINLAKIKSEVATLQRNMLINERKARTSEAILREESLKLDIEIKKKQLEILTGMAIRHAS